MFPRDSTWWLLGLVLFSERTVGFNGRNFLPSRSNFPPISIDQSDIFRNEASPDTDFIGHLRARSAAFSLALCIGAAPSWAHALSPQPPPPSLFDSVLNTIVREYVPRNGADQPSTALLEEAAVKAALRALDDPYTSLVPLGNGANTLSTTIAAGKKSDTQSVGAVDLGLAVVKDSKVPNALVVVGVDEGSPAEVADFRVGDRIVSFSVLPPSSSSRSTSSSTLEINDEEEILVNAVLPLADLAAQLREANSVSVERDGLGAGRKLRLQTPIASRKPLMSQRSISLAGSLLPPSSVVGLPIAYVRLDNFGPRAADEVANALAAIAGNDGSSTDSLEGDVLIDDALEPTIALSGVVLDLRHNPGGRLDAAVDVASLFLPEDTPVATLFGGSAAAPSTPSSAKDAKSKDETSQSMGVQLTAQGGALVAPSTKIVVLVDSATTSAAELVAASLQEADRAVLVGDHRTFGKAAAQENFDIPATITMPNAREVGVTRQLRITTARYETPMGRRLDGSRPSNDVLVGSKIRTAGSSRGSSSSSGRISYYSAHGRPLHAPTPREPGVTPDLWVRYDGVLLPWASLDEAPTSATASKSRRSQATNSKLSQASLLEAEEEAAAADRALVASGAYFEWASDWCIRHPNLVALSAANRAAGAEALDEVLRGDRSDADLRSSTIGSANKQESSAAKVGYQQSRRRSTGTTQSGGDTDGRAEVTKNDALEAEVIYQDFRRYLTPRGALPWARSPVLEALATAKNSFNCDIPPGSACSSRSPGSSGGEDGGPAVMVTKRAVQQAESTAVAALQSALETPSGKALASSRCEAAIRARFLTAGEVRRQTTAHDPTVRAATNLLTTNPETNQGSEAESKMTNQKQRRGNRNSLSSATNMYAAALEVPALKDQDGNMLSPTAPVSSNDEVGESGTVPGYEALGQCLPLQTCNEREFVYLSLT